MPNIPQPQNRVGHLLFDSIKVARRAKPYDRVYAPSLMMQYSKCPGHVLCPTCLMPITVVCFVANPKDEDFLADPSLSDPIGNYVPVVLCHRCMMMLGLGVPINPKENER